ncbi:glycosyltransferase family 2 protein [Campylobacter sp. 19-13652]|uniref:glycosyltransferase family 2 protein n=1 Tax=Campylobacter sp. 19-13652 TaxID=2840180 RepID=UPI001C79044D|nr:glycosyltransferase family 2 protein [Campylobacter sp. 19-13652]BCX80033.1 LPS biosynthesis [Campylobacter sp. 19-13652]
MLSVVILTFNSQKYLTQVLSSVSWADEVLCIDSGSADDTAKIISEHKNTRLIFQPWLGFGAQKQFGVDAAKNEWVFVLDSDEVFTPQLEAEVKSVLKSPKFNAYRVPRLNYFFGKPVRNMGLYPDFSVRLFSKHHARFSDDAVHERVIANGDVGELAEHFLHYAYESVEQFITKQNRYSSLSAKKSRLKAIFNPIWTFVRLYFLRGGYKEGWCGYVIARLYAQYTFWKYVK